MLSLEGSPGPATPLGLRPTRWSNEVSNLALAEKLFKDMLSAQISPSVYTLTAMVKVPTAWHDIWGDRR